MKIVLTALFTVGLIIVVLRSDLTPWRIINKNEITKLSQPQVIERRVLVPAAPVGNHSGDWMRDPNYRSALERTTVIGRPEPAAIRDVNKPLPTPGPPRP